MKSRIPLGLSAVAIALPWCCILPLAFSVLGLAGFAIAVRHWLAGPLEYLTLAVSISLVLRAFYLSVWQRRGPWWSRLTVIASAVAVAALWVIRL